MAKSIVRNHSILDNIIQRKYAEYHYMVKHAAYECDKHTNTEIVDMHVTTWASNTR